MTITSIVLDLITAAFIFTTVFIAYRRGFISTVLNLAGFLISSVLASLLSSPITNFIFNKIARPSLINYVSGKINEISGGKAVPVVLNEVFESLPGFIKNFAGLGTGGEAAVKKSVETAAAGSLERLSEQIVDIMFAPIVTMIISALIYTLLFLIFILVFKALSRTFTFVNKIPLIGGVNKILGAAFGLVQALLLMLIIAILVSIISAFTGGGLQADINKTIIFKWFYYLNPFLKLMLKI